MVREVDLREVEGALDQSSAPQQPSPDTVRRRKIVELEAELEGLRERLEREPFDELQELQELLQQELEELRNQELQEVQELNEARSMLLASRRAEELKAAASVRETPEKLREAALMLRAMAIESDLTSEAVEC